MVDLFILFVNGLNYFYCLFASCWCWCP